MWSREKLDMLRKMLIIWQEAGDDAEKVIPGHVMKGLLLHVYSTGKGNSLAHSKRRKGNTPRSALERLLW